MKEDTRDILIVAVLLVVCVFIGILLGKSWARQGKSSKVPAALHQQQEGVAINEYYKMMRDKNGKTMIVPMTAEEIVKNRKNRKGR